MDKKILIVDDSGSMRGMLMDLLEKAGYLNVSSAINGEEALALYNKEHHDLIILDIIMPGKSGIDVLREIGSTCKVLVLSAIGQDTIIEEAKKLGALDYLVKPIEEADVLAKVARYLK